MSLGVGAANAQEVVLAGVFSGKVLLVIDGGAPRTLSVGQQVEGVRLINVGRESAEIETVNGFVPVWHVRLRRVGLGNIMFDDVEGVVLQTEMPAVLLGMNFLNRMEMKRDGSTMVLRQRY